MNARSESTGELKLEDGIHKELENGALYTQQDLRNTMEKFHLIVLALTSSIEYVVGNLNPWNGSSVI
jgi:hypothetical protein